MSDKEKIAKLKDFVEETRAQIRGEKESIGQAEDNLSRLYRGSLDYAESIVDQVSQILEGDV
jgi:hypothetical protein